jgi:Calcineurin-like phosphoesterase
MRAPRLLAALSFALALACSAPPEPARPAFAPDVRFSLLAVGDTGRNNQPVRLFDEQVGTGLAMAAEHRARPVDALLFLGDNFYFSGLQAQTVESQLRDNLVRPYCTFVDLEGPLSPRVADACGVPEAERRPVPIYAILGNHDYGDPTSPERERAVIREYVSNWHMAPVDFDVIAVAPGVSLITAESTPYLGEGDLSPFTRAIAHAPGPWRIVAIHKPPSVQVELESSQRLIAAIRGAGAPVQLFLSGDEHNLEVQRAPDGLGGLHVVAGGGSDAEEVRPPPPPFGLASRGFARVDLVRGRDGGEERIYVSIFATPRFPLDYRLGRGRTLVARWSVDLSGSVREEPLSAAGAPPGSSATR